MSVEFRLHSMEFECKPRQHVAFFELIIKSGDDNTATWTMPVYVDDTGQGLDHIFAQAHQNLLNLLDLLKEQATVLQKAYVRPPK